MNRRTVKASPRRTNVKLKRQRPLLVIQASVNNQRPADFIVDTGASASVITPEMGEELGVRLSKRQATAVGASGQQSVRMARLKSLRIGSVEVHNLQITIMSLASLHEATRLRVAGIIGYDVLRRFKVTIDYPNNQIFFQGPSAPRMIGESSRSIGKSRGR